MLSRILRLSPTLIALALCGAASNGSAETKSDIPKTNPASLRWWQTARLGLFIHWGPVSLKGTEIGWSRGARVSVEDYDRLYERFNPTNFNAVQWAQVAKAAGAKYLVLTAKHHDGFCLWDSRFTDYTIMHTPFHRDVVKELAAACRTEGIVFCAYYSILDWHHPDYPLDSPAGKSRKPEASMGVYDAYLRGQIAELVHGYGPLGILWFDGEWEQPWTTDRGINLYRYCRQLQDSVLVNNRVGKGRQSMAGTTTAGQFAGDYDTPEQRVGTFQNRRPWESSITLCEQWAWKPNDKLKSLKQCVQTLVRTAGGDGNLLLNVGPMPTGEIEPRQVARLTELGNWLQQNGQSIYATRGGPFKPASWGVSTCRDQTIFLHVLNWGGRARLVLPPIEPQILTATTLEGSYVDLNQTKERVELTVPPAQRSDLDTIIVLKLPVLAAEIPPQ